MIFDRSITHELGCQKLVYFSSLPSWCFVETEHR